MAEILAGLAMVRSNSQFEGFLGFAYVFTILAPHLELLTALLALIENSADSIRPFLTIRSCEQFPTGRTLDTCGSQLVLAQREMEKRRSPLVSIPPFGRGFLRHGGLSIRWGFWAARERVLTPPFIVSMSPPGYPSAWLRPRSARFRFTRHDHCSSALATVCAKNFCRMWS